MAQVTANHRFILNEILLQKGRYDSELSNYISLYEQWKKMPMDLNISARLLDCICRLKGIKYSLALNISAYLEAMINFYLASNMEWDRFKIIERRTLEYKWMHAVSIFDSKFVFPKSGVIDQGLKTLKRTRNAIAHMKPMIKHGENVTHDGLNPDCITNDQSDRHMIDQWVKLPTLLLSEMGKYIDEPKLRGLKYFGGLA